MASPSNPDKWYFTKEYLENTPSRESGFDAYKELQYRQQAANFIQDMGQKLQVSQLCINTAIVYMHRFYVFHSFTKFPWHQMASAALFLAAKVEEQPRKLEYVIRVTNLCRNPRDRTVDVTCEKDSPRYIAQSQEMVFNENVLLQTLGFDVAIDHPHTYIVRCCHLVRASKDLAQTSYFMASNSLHLTTMCIQYKPTVVACFCILLTCKWSNWEIPLSNEKKEWFKYVDPTVTAELLEQLTSEFLVIFENCPSRLKEKIMAKQESSSSTFEPEKKLNDTRSLEHKSEDHHKHRSSRPAEAGTSGHRSQEQREREYKERKEKERIAHMSGIVFSLPYRPDRPPDASKPYGRPPPTAATSSRNEPREVLRETVKELAAVASTVREHGKDVYASRGDKEVQKRDSLLKSSAQSDPSSSSSYADARMQQRVEPSRPRNEPPKASSKVDMPRRHEDQKVSSHAKQEAENIKKHLSASFDRSSGYLKASSSSSTSQKVKSPSNLDSKSVPRANSNQLNALPKLQFNGNPNGTCDNKPPLTYDNDFKTKTEINHLKEEIPTPVVIKRPSLFSPDQTPQLPQIVIKSEPEKSLTSLTLLSPINSPPSVSSLRNRNYSSSSEPELRPTMKKIDQVEGFENLMRDNTIGMTNVSNNDTLLAAEQHDSSLEVDVSTCSDEAVSKPLIINGFETNPTLISNLLKEASTASHLSAVGLSTVKAEPIEPIQANVSLSSESSNKEHRHHKSKKKKDKHKRKDKSKEEKEKKRKHKDKDRERSKHKERKESEPQPIVSEPIKITIQKDKIQPKNELKIKIPKDRIKTEGMGDSFGLAQPSSGGLKIKIPKDIITNCQAGTSSFNSFDKSHSGGSSSSRKRERSSTSETANTKMHKSAHKESKQNGRHSSNKVSSIQPSSSNSFRSSECDGISEIRANIETGHSNVVIGRNNAPIEKNVTIDRTLDRLIEKRDEKTSSLVANLPSMSTNMRAISPIPFPTKKGSNATSGDSVWSMSVSQEGCLNPSKTTAQDSPPSNQKSRGNPLDAEVKPALKRPPYYQATANTPSVYKSFNHNNSQFKTANRQSGSINKHVRHNYDYPPPPPYHMKDTNRQPSVVNPRFQSPMPPRFNRVENSYPSMVQNPEMHYAQLMPQMGYSGYQVAPPVIPNVSMPPPPFGYFPNHYFEGYMYQQQAAAFGVGVTQPPLPTDAPPLAEVPPPPPPE
ncbi:hypothetical protein HUJ04_004622 [Dendroctonus ponderosae]|uniref:Cyclin-like domain-containing protein n=1 Tax=Dendroctonus ponderosae TaxID=77166 RepID=A0AAR5PYN8_DENPD|nr:hypothetical protein HUJ04_004622 [Dendroctonus ponderosae]KAH1007380.1 hypothetical protein HUJ04_004622 [Dendroctonus ponderosae]